MSTTVPGRPELPIPEEDMEGFDMIMQHGFKDNATWVSYNYYGDRFAAGSVDGKIRVFNRHSDGTWRICDTWAAHGGEVLEIQWLPPTVYPNLIASLGIEGRFRLWAEDPSAAPGRRFSSRTSSADGSRAAFEIRNPGAAPQAYRSFSIKHNEETRHTYLALLAADGMLSVLENESPENFQEWADIDRLRVCPKPSRGEEQAFRVRFDPNEMVCYTALRAGVPADSLSLVVAAMNTCKLYRTRDPSYSGSTSTKEFYLAAELPGHTGLVRDVSWASGNIRGYDIIATACSDGFVRIFRVDTPFNLDDGRTWSESDILYHRPDNRSQGPSSRAGPQDQSRAQHSGIGAGLAHSGPAGDRSGTSGQHGVIPHVIREVGRHDKGRVPVWRVSFTADGQILGSSSDDGKLILYRRKPDGSWAKYSELGVEKAPMVAA